jgi:hypothetical protein
LNINNISKKIIIFASKKTRQFSHFFGKKPYIMSDFCVYIEMPPYLKDWFVHDSGGEYPVKLIRGSMESSLLETFLAPQPAGLLPELPGEGKVAICIPYFKRKDPRTYHYLSKQAKSAFLKLVQTRFDLQMWKELNKFGRIGKQLEDLIYAWMDKHDIAPTETNWNAIAKRYQRKRNIYLTVQKRAQRFREGKKVKI